MLSIEVQWDAAKDRDLWQVLSTSSKDTEIEWHTLADHFDVTLSFLLQQAAWLYERQLSQVREQLRKVNKPPTSARSSPAPDSISGSTNVGGYAMRRGGSGDSRVPSSLSQRARDSPSARHEAPGTPVRKVSSLARTASTNTVTQTQKIVPTSNLQPPRRALEVMYDGNVSTSPRQHEGLSEARSPSPKAESSSVSSSSSSEPQPLSHSRAITRRPRYTTQKKKAKNKQGLLSSADEEDDNDDTDDDDAPAFLPFSNPGATETPQSPQDPSATLRRLPSNTTRKEPPSTIRTTNTNPQSQPKAASRAQPQSSTKTAHSSSSSLSSAFPASNTQSNTLSSPGPGMTSPIGPLSALSPRTRRMAREGSEGTPSMGSSFSDLDDASLTQSALEEQMAREIRDAGSLGVVSRMGGLWKNNRGGRMGGS
ncbi:hypothetical protein MMC19_001436 [Ptychographa xylographoides]|nr:hypothetical protein [Ptychographa xylographoides]